MPDIKQIIYPYLHNVYKALNSDFVSGAEFLKM